jgi:hypothetical protein
MRRPGGVVSDLRFRTSTLTKTCQWFGLARCFGQPRLSGNPAEDADSSTIHWVRAPTRHAIHQ